MIYQSMKTGMEIFFLSAMTLGVFWFGGCNAKNLNPGSPNSLIQAQTPTFSSTGTPAVTTTPTSIVTFTPTVVSNPGNGIVLDNGILAMGGTGGTGGSVVVGPVTGDNSNVSLVGGMGGSGYVSGGSGGNVSIGVAGATLTISNTVSATSFPTGTPTPSF
jgi:hypothetical protein